MRTSLSLFAATALACSAVQAQTAAPVIVQPAAGATMQPAPASPSAPANSASEQQTLKLLQDMKAANDETLKKQQAALLQLEEIQKAADQIRIYTKRS